MIPRVPEPDIPPPESEFEEIVNNYLRQELQAGDMPGVLVDWARNMTWEVIASRTMGFFNLRNQRFPTFLKGLERPVRLNSLDCRVWPGIREIRVFRRS